MRRMLILGSCLVVAGAAGTTLTASASAALPELGRCEKVERVLEGKRLRFHGAYTNASCTRVSKTKRGRYEWTAGPGAANKFYEPGDGTEETFETVDGAALVCGNSTLTGEYTGPKTEKISSLVLTTCENSVHKICQSNPKDPGQVESTESMEGELGRIAKGHKKPWVGWDLKSVKLIYYCGGEEEVPQPAVVEGSVIGKVAPGASSNLDLMNTESLIEYTAKEGKQLPEAFEGGADDTLTTRYVLSGLASPEQTGLTGTEAHISGLGEAGETAADKEALEIKALPEEVAVS